MKIKELFREVKYPIELFDKNGNQVYFGDSTGFWYKQEFDSNGNLVYLENSNGYWVKYEYDSNGNQIYYKDSDGDWVIREYDSNGNQIYSETSKGKIVDNRPKTEITMDQIAEKFGIPVSNLKIKKQ